MVITHTHAKGQGQRLLDSKVRAETDSQRQTDGWTDGWRWLLPCYVVDKNHFQVLLIKLNKWYALMASKTHRYALSILPFHSVSPDCQKEMW